MVEAVLSDIDGTLVESNWLHAAAWRDAFAVIDIPLGIETLRKQIGRGGDQLMGCKLSPQPSMEKYG
jgi:beta-phosphoglucomutase-like phosphatase (HAD superfamily)